MFVCVCVCVCVFVCLFVCSCGVCVCVFVCLFVHVACVCVCVLYVTSPTMISQAEGGLHWVLRSLANLGGGRGGSIWF